MGSANRTDKFHPKTSFGPFTQKTTADNSLSPTSCNGDVGADPEDPENGEEIGFEELEMSFGNLSKKVIGMKKFKTVGTEKVDQEKRKVFDMRKTKSYKPCYTPSFGNFSGV